MRGRIALQAALLRVRSLSRMNRARRKFFVFSGHDTVRFAGANS